MNLIFSKRAPLAFAAVIAAGAFASCKSDSSTGPAAPASVVASVSPSATTIAGVATAGPAVLVTDGGGSPAAGVEVRFAVTSGGGSIQYPIVITGADGIASAGKWQIGNAGTNTVAAAVEGLPPVTFTTTASLGNATAVSKSSGNNQIGPPAIALPQPVTVKVVTAGGLGVPGATVTFTVTAGGGSVSASPVVTDANGFASTIWTLGPAVGTNTLDAQSGSLTTTFTATAVLPCDDRIPMTVGQTKTGTLAFSPIRCQIGGFATDRYALSTLNEAIKITLTSTAFDPVINLWNSGATTPIATNDDDPAGGTTNSAVRVIVVAGTKTVDATTKTAGATGAYSLAVASASADVAGCQTVYIEVGATTNQTLATTDCNNLGHPSDSFKVYIAAGQTVRLRENSAPVDATLELYNPLGVRVAQNDDFNGTDSQITYTATTAGYYTIAASAYGLVFANPYGAEYGVYTLIVDTP